jgi:hypothetical protein
MKNRKRILQWRRFRLTWTKERWEWEAFMDKIYEHRYERHLWHGLEEVTPEWETFLRRWMQIDGDFFVGRNGDAAIVGACWVTDIVAGESGKFHLVTFPSAERILETASEVTLERILRFGLEKKAGPCYRYLIGETPYLAVARAAKMHGLGDYETKERFFGDEPGYIINILPKENSDGWRRRPEAAVSAEAPAASRAASDQGVEGRRAGADGRAGAPEEDEGTRIDPAGPEG